MRPSYEIEVAEQARKPRKVEYGARTPHALSSVSFTHGIGWRVLRQCRKETSCHCMGSTHETEI